MSAGSELYQRVIAMSDELMNAVWKGTPWMVDTYTGSISNYGRYCEIMEWCRKQFGDEASPLHGQPGNWYSGNATINGRTWMGFATEDMMRRFVERWGGSERAES